MFRSAPYGVDLYVLKAPSARARAVRSWSLARPVRDEAVYAIVNTGGRQHRAEVGRIMKTQKLAVDVGTEVVLDQVLAIHDGDKLRVGTPILEGASVTGRVIQQGRDPKIRVAKFKKKKGYRKTIGHRQSFTVVQVTGIEPG